MKPPFDLTSVDAATDAVMAQGHRLFQTHRYSDDDAEHVALLTEMMAPPRGGIVLDAGCGIGEVARLMSEARPDLSFILMNVSLHQLSKCPVGEQYLHALDDCHATLLNDSVVDAAMYSSALCQMDIPVALTEARRVLKPGGVLLINDMVHAAGHQMALEQAIAARVLSRAELVEMLEQAGFAVERIEQPPHDSSHFDQLAAEAGIGELVAGIEPIIIRAIARKEAA